MPFGHFLLRGLVLFFAPQFLLSAAGQSSAADHTPVPIANLHQLIQRSGYIFDGTVVSVERVADVESGSVEWVQITFRIEEAIRGTRKGQRLTIREWGGCGIQRNATRSGNASYYFFTGRVSLALPAQSEARWDASPWALRETWLLKTHDAPFSRRIQVPEDQDAVRIGGTVELGRSLLSAKASSKTCGVCFTRSGKPLRDRKR